MDLHLWPQTRCDALPFFSSPTPRFPVASLVLPASYNALQGTIRVRKKPETE